MSTLILVPTAMEMQRLMERLPVESPLRDAEVVWQIVGFGPIAAAARTSSLIQILDPSRVVLVGIAGTYEPDLHPIATAASFGEVVCDGVGVGQGDQHQSAGQMGWPQFEFGGFLISKSSSHSFSDSPNNSNQPDIGDQLDLIADPTAQGSLVTTCAASLDWEEAATRRRRHPAAIGEDMEGFGVAMACRLADKPAAIIRGFSNRVGDRDSSSWDINGALDSASVRLTQWFTSESQCP